VLIDLLNAVVQPTRTITGLEIVPTHSEMDTPRDKQVIADIKARDQGQRQFHLEMQWETPWFFPNRILFYWAKFHSQQLRVGEDYQILRPTIFACFANQIVYPGEDDFHLIFRLLEVKKGKQSFSGDLEVHLIELPKFTKRVEQLSSALDRWCYFLRHGAELDLEALPANLDAPMIRRAMEVLTVWTKEESEREAYELQLKFLRDQSSLMREVRESRAAEQAAAEKVRAAEQAAAEKVRAVEQEVRVAERETRFAEQKAFLAKEQGVAMGQIRAYQQILKQPQTPEAELAAMSQEDLASLIAQLHQQVFPKGG
jgi:predicted transposase/invertase (TIGR01784 family)